MRAAREHRTCSCVVYRRLSWRERAAWEPDRLTAAVRWTSRQNTCSHDERPKREPSPAASFDRRTPGTDNECRSASYLASRRPLRQLHWLSPLTTSPAAAAEDAAPHRCDVLGCDVLGSRPLWKTPRRRRYIQQLWTNRVVFTCTRTHINQRLSYAPIYTRPTAERRQNRTFVHDSKLRTTDT